MHKKLTKRTLAAALKKLTSEWKLNTTGNQLVLCKKFDSYLQAFMFVTRVSINAEVFGEYPKIILTKSSVKISIETETGFTDNDIQLVQRIDQIALSTKSS